MMNKLCEYGVYQTKGIHHILKCNLINDNCTFIRWCGENQCIKNTDSYLNCKVRRKEMSNKLDKNDDIGINKDNEVIDDIKKLENDDKKIIIPIKLKEEICKIIWIKSNKFAVSFNDYGITIDGSINNDKDNIKIKYEGEIGKSDFKIISYE